jgi:hypothetical protein
MEVLRGLLPGLLPIFLGRSDTGVALSRLVLCLLWWVALSRLALLSTGTRGASSLWHTGGTATLLLVLLPGAARLLPVRYKLPGRLDTGNTKCSSAQRVKEGMPR